MQRGDIAGKIRWIQEEQLSGLKDEVERKRKRKQSLAAIAPCHTGGAWTGGELRKKQIVTVNHAKPATSKSAC